MSKWKARSLQEIKKRRQTSEFVGREEQLALFHQSLVLSPDDELRRFIFNVSGQGGVGKSSLLRRFREMAQSTGAISAWTDESEGDLVAVMASVARQFAKQGFPLQNFDDRYQRYHQREENGTNGSPQLREPVLHPLQSEAQHAVPTSELAVKSPDRSNLRRQLTEQFSDDELRDVCFDLEIDYESLRGDTKNGKVRELILHAERQSRTADLMQTVQQHRSPLKSIKSAHRQRGRAGWLDEDQNFFRSDWNTEPMRALIDKAADHETSNLVDVLMPALVEDLGRLPEGRAIVLFFDTYERTCGYLDQWLRDMLDGRYGDVPSNIILAIAGRHALDHNHWSPYSGLMASLSLDPFSPDEARSYLEHKGITEESVIQIILKLSGCFPLLVATLAKGNPNSPEHVDDPSDTAIERFLKWEDDPQRRQIAVDAALPRHLNRDVLAVLTGKHDTDALFTWLRGRPFVSERAQGWTYHDVVREQMLRHQRRQSPQTFAERHGQLAAYYEHHCATLGLDEDKQWQDATWQKYALEVLYHRLCQSPHRELTHALNGFLAALKAKRTFARQWAETIQQAGGEADVAEVQRWGKQLVEGLQAYEEDRDAAAIPVFTQLLEMPDLKPRHRAVAFAYRGGIYRSLGRYDEALQDLDRALELDPQYKWALASRGQIHGLMENYAAALADFNRALALNPQDAWVLIQRGIAHRLRENYAAALADFNHALELDSQYAWALTSRGAMYSEIQNYPAALADLDRALALDPQDAWALGSRGQTYRQLQNYPAALADLDRALTLDSEQVWLITERGKIYQLQQNYAAALADFDRALELAPQDAWALILRGETHRQMENYTAALADFDHALELDSQDDWHSYSRALTYQLLEQRDQAEADLTTAIRLAQQQYEQNPKDWRNIFNLAIYHLAANNTAIFEKLYQEGQSGNAPVEFIRMAIQDLNDFLVLFPEHARAKEIRTLLQQHLDSIVARTE